MANKYNTRNILGAVSDSLKRKKGLSEEERRLETLFLVDEIGSVDVDGALEKVRRKMKGDRTARRLYMNLIRVAAMLTVPLLVFSIWQFTSRNAPGRYSEADLSWQEIRNPSGIRSKVVLPDGSYLWLNAESKIGYTIPFVRKNRQIELSGEAYFEVRENKKIPFVIKAADTEIRVLGTQFNVKAYAEEKSIEVALKEGSVIFTAVQGESEELSATLGRNDYLVFDNAANQFTIENRDVDPYISWHQNILIFDDMPLIEWSRIMERWYGVKIDILDEEIKEYHFNGTFRDETVRDVMQILELTLNISVTMEGKNITIEKSAS